MAEKSIEQRVKDIIVEQLGVNADQVTPEAKFIEDLGADSLDTVELVMALEEEFGHEIPDEQAEKLRDPTHVRSYSEEEWRELLEDAGVEVERVEYFEKTHDTEEWLARCDCTGEDAARVRELLRPVSSEDGRTWRDTKILIKGRKSQR